MYIILVLLDFVLISMYNLHAISSKYYDRRDVRVLEINKASRLFITVVGEKIQSIERCSTGIGNYVFIVRTSLDNKYILRCSEDKKAYNDTIYWLPKLKDCNIPVPEIKRSGTFENYKYLILSYAEGKEIGDIYSQLTDDEKKQIAKEVIDIQKQVAKIKSVVPSEWGWNSFVEEMLSRSYELISTNGFFDVAKLEVLRVIHGQLREYFASVKPNLYLDDISTKNLLISNGHVSSVIDIDWMGFGDILTFVAMTKVALLNMDYDTVYVDYLLEEIRPNKEQYKAFVFYCLLFCVDFMSERGTTFLDKVIPVNQEIIDRLNRIYDNLLIQWKNANQA